MNDEEIDRVVAVLRKLASKGVVTLTGKGGAVERLKEMRKDNAD